jgi:hypothetical protein
MFLVRARDNAATVHRVLQRRRLKLETGEFFALSNADSVHFRSNGPVRRAQTCDAGRAGARPYRRLGGSCGSASHQRKVGNASPLCTLQNQANPDGSPTS